MTNRLVRIEYGKICAGVDVDEDNIIVETAPYFNFALGWHISKLLAKLRGCRFQYL